jgi:hypothetical protein
VPETTFYLQVEPVWANYRNRDGDLPLRGIKVTKLVQNRPTRITGVGVKLTLRIPDAAFKPLSPEVVIDVPESALDYEPVVTVNGQLPQETTGSG